MGNRLSFNEVIIPIEDRKLPATYLGQGSHSEAYLTAEGVYIFVKTEDPMKEMLSKIGHTPEEAPHIPQIRHVETQVWKNGGWGGKRYIEVYHSPYYEPLTAKHREAWNDFKILVGARKRGMAAAKRESPIQWENRYTSLGDKVNIRTSEFAQEMGITPSLYDDFYYLCYRALDYGEWYICEFSKPNLKVGPHGQLILLDCFYDWRE